MMELIGEIPNIDFKELYWFSPLDIEDYDEIFKITNHNESNDCNYDLVKIIRDKEKVILFLYKYIKKDNIFIDEIVRYYKEKYNINRYETYILNDNDIKWFNSDIYKFEQKIKLKNFIKVKKSFLDVFMYELLV